MTLMLRHLRVLPTLIALASLLLAVKLGNVWIGTEDTIRTAFSVANAAEPEDGPMLNMETAASGKTEEPPADEGGTEAQTTEAADAAAPDAAEIASQPPPSGAPSSDISAAEVEVLQQLAERRKALEAREREIAERAALLEAAETRIDQKVEDLKSLQAALEQLTKRRDEQEEAKIASLVKIYENMKPKDAARIFEELEMETLLLVADRMKERKLAAIMAEMDPAKAKDMTVELARLRALPSELIGAQG